MVCRISRRSVLAATATAWVTGGMTLDAWAQPEKRNYQISLVESSLQQAIGQKKIDHLDLAKVAKTEFEIMALEYDSRFFGDKASDEKYLAEMNKRAADQGVRQLLIHVESEGSLGQADAAQGRKLVESLFPWVDAAKMLGCHSIQVSVVQEGDFETQIKRTAEDLRLLSEYADSRKINVLIANDSGLAANAEWIVKLLGTIDRPGCGTGPKLDAFARRTEYEKLAKLLSFAKAAAVTARQFDKDGNAKEVDYLRMMQVVCESGYHGYLGIAYAGKQLDEYAGVRATKKLLDKINASIG